MYVNDVEGAFVRMLANRVLNFVREAASRGEEYHDIRQPTLLSCGWRAKMTHTEKPGGYKTTVQLWPPSLDFIEADMPQKIAEELVGGPVVPSESKNYYAFDKKDV